MVVIVVVTMTMKLTTVSRSTKQAVHLSSVKFVGTVVLMVVLEKMIMELFA